MEEGQGGNAFQSGVSNPGFSGAVTSQGGGLGSNPPSIAQETGDIILNSGGGKKRGWIFAVISILAVAIIVVVVAVFAGRNKGGEDTGEADFQAFYNILNENADNVDEFTSLVANVYSGNISMRNFMLSEEQSKATMEQLDAAETSFATIKKRMDDGPVIAGTIQEIDLEANYYGMEEIFDEEYEKYMEFINITRGILKVFQSNGTEKASEVLSEYNVGVLANAIDDFFETAVRVSQSYLENSCDVAVTQICESLKAEISNYRSILENAGIFTQGYKDAIGEIKYEGENTLAWYYANLLSGVGLYVEK